MKLYYAPGTCSLTPHIILHELNISAELVRVDLTKQSLADGGDFSKVNSRGQVPVLRLDDGSVLREGSVIVQFLADSNQHHSLLPAPGSAERYPVLEWQNFVATEIHKGYAPLFNRQLDAAGKATLKEALHNKYQWLNSHLASSTFLSGDDYTVADAYLFVVSRWAAPVELNLSELEHVQRLLHTVGQRPAVQAAMHAEGLL